MKCGFGGCKSPAVWECRKLWGTGGTLMACDRHKPGTPPPTVAAVVKRLFYDVRPLGNARADA